MLGVSLVVGFIKLETNFYVIVNPSWIDMPKAEDSDLKDDNIDLDVCNTKIEIVCYELWGEGTPFKVLEKSVNDFVLDEDANKFDEQIEAYRTTCKRLNEKYEVDLKREIEMSMMSMGLPLCCSFENEFIGGDIFIVMTKSDFERIVMPRVKEIFTDKNVKVKTEEDVSEKILELSKTICNCYRKR